MFTDPPLEYYIIEDYIPYNPAPHWIRVGTVVTDGSTYALFDTTIGTTRKQYWAVRLQKRQEGSVNVADFLAAFETAGATLGQHAWTIVTIMGHFSRGTARVTVDLL